MDLKNLDGFLEENVKPATGCTEPVAVAYATSLAYHSLQSNQQKWAENQSIRFDAEVPLPKIENLESIMIKTDRDVYKNALAVSIPGTNGEKGMKIASAIGLYCHPKDGLNLFHGLDIDTVKKGRKILQDRKVNLEDITDDGSRAELDIGVSMVYRVDGKSKRSYVRLHQTHDHIARIEIDGILLYDSPCKTSSERKEKEKITIKNLVESVKNMTLSQKDKVYQGILMNEEIAKEGLNGNYGLQSGKSLSSMEDYGIKSEDLISQIKIYAASAGDARMGGASHPVMSTAGSGNQGITALIPIAVTGRHYGIPKEKISEAAMLSHLVTKYAKEESGHLSAICGCAIKAGVGAAAGITYLLDGNLEQINSAINIMASNITGMICDGAKESCALKLSTAAGTAAESAFMALGGMKIPSDNGIIYDDAADTIRAIGRVSYSMIETDLEIVRIMQEK